MRLFVFFGLFLLWNLNIRGFRIQDFTSLKFMRGVREAYPFSYKKASLFSLLLFIFVWFFDGGGWGLLIK
jgi:hypothetical protein